MLSKKMISLVSIGCVLSASSGAYASDKQVLAEIKALKAKISQLETQVAASEKKADTQVQATNEKVNALAKEAAKDSGSDVKIKLKPAPSISTADGKTTFEIDGRIMTDAGFVVNGSDTEIGNAVDMRALWIGLKGKVDNEWNYRFQVGFDNNEVAVKDAFLAYNGIKNLSLSAGHFYENNGIEFMSSSLNTTFMEPSSAISAFRAQRYLGVSADPYGDNWGAQIGVFGTGVDETDDTDDEGYSLAARGHFAPIKNKDMLLHIGGNARYRAIDSATDSVKFKARGESHVIDATLISTGDIAGADVQHDYALEGLFRYKGFYALGEYDFTTLDRVGADSLDFQGGYLTLGYVLTGEQREYNAKRGTLGRLSPTEPFSFSGKGMGAFEVAARYDHLDLEDRDIQAGTMDSYTLGLNWYPTSYTRFMVNYVYNDLDKNSAFAEDPQYVMMRAQVDF